MTLCVTILGCGSSGGVPRVGSGWGACDPANPKNRRRRCSILVERAGPGGVTRVLIDTSPDLRDQLLDAGVERLDAVLYTHDHADHTHGIDDLRPLAIHMRRRVDVHLDAATSATLHARFGYCFRTPPGSDYPPILNEHRLVALQETVIDGAGGPIRFLPFVTHHGTVDALGFRFDDMAYAPDVSDFPPESLPALEGLDLWILDALRPSRHPSHLSLAEALGWIDRMQPRRAVLTNLHTDLDYGQLVDSLPAQIVPAFDGMRLASIALNENDGKPMGFVEQFK
jgi:phosphoribosyl 1,2-cyclic phosphate phosphodiesterase